ncbi:adaptive-response sensory-kinase [Corallococcus coralloides DSM 2259]|uniref:histidine kinase n=1 Tax=Corallococcus coralloides (strain ATCC 25202 / DSM 2259 / NBRC 100086 / M2) TaxID=1144275 RepID=H8MWE8_CORCM|nr:GAF domain-containing sensor histidine kinase [Corallococcus coralloides]AFE10301.1 adaptive-response sensory-kinase [Corallococcus coralloides DSM 2259]
MGSGWEDPRLRALEQLLALPAAELRPTLDTAGQLISELLNADKVDVFLFEQRSQSLVAVGTSQTPMAHLQKSLGLDRMPLANGGRAVQVYETETPFMTGHQEEDPDELPGIKHRLGVRSSLMVPLPIGMETRGVLAVSSARNDFFTDHDLRFLHAVARWVGMVAHRVELVQELTKLAVKQARRKAAEELITVLAHDMANHLLPLQARIQLIQRRAQRNNEPEDLRDATGAAASLRSLTRLINDLLDVGRLDQGLFSLRSQPVDLTGLVRELAATASTSEHPVRFEGPEELVTVADPDRVRQVLENVVANALKHSPPGQPVDIHLQAQARPEGPWVRVTVNDQGTGIPTEQQSTLFERFSRGPGSKGLGIGLYLARRIAEAHGGTLEVVSTARTGTSFALSLPVVVG